MNWWVIIGILFYLVAVTYMFMMLPLVFVYFPFKVLQFILSI
jgi:hypothetical protein